MTKVVLVAYIIVVVWVVGRQFKKLDAIQVGGASLDE